MEQTSLFGDEFPVTAPPKNNRTRFSKEEAKAARDAGKAEAKERRTVLLNVAREVAGELVKKNGTVTVDDVFKEMQSRGMHPECLGNAAGSIFDKFTFTGQWKKSERVSNHSRAIRIWTA